MTIADDLVALKQVQLDLRSAIEAMGVPVGAAPFTDYPTFVLEINQDDTSTDLLWDSEILEWDLDGDTLIWELDE